MDQTFLFSTVSKKDEYSSDMNIAFLIKGLANVHCFQLAFSPLEYIG